MSFGGTRRRHQSLGQHLVSLVDVAILVIQDAERNEYLRQILVALERLFIIGDRLRILVEFGIDLGKPKVGGRISGIIL